MKTKSRDYRKLQRARFYFKKEVNNKREAASTNLPL